MHAMLPSLTALLVLLVLTLKSCCASSERVCNNSPLLCDRQYNHITHLGAHDSPFVRNASNGYSLSGDQFYTSTVQLSAGVRLLTGQVHAFVGKHNKLEWHLCHTLCELYDDGPLSSWLELLKGWLDRNKNDVITILLVNADDATAPELGKQFEDSGIVNYAYVPADTTKPTTKWPTLNQLIDMDKRLIIYIADLDPNTNTAAPYLLNEFTFVFENNYDNDKPTEFSCTANRPAQYNNKTSAALASGRMPLMNHFLYRKLTSAIEIPAVGRAHDTNAPSGKVGNLGDSANECTKEYGMPPPYILVDFFNEGPAIETVDRLNGVVGHVSGRKKVSENGKPVDVSGGGSSSSSTAASQKTPKLSPSSAPSSSSGSGSVTGTGATASASAGSNAGAGQASNRPSTLISLAILAGLSWLIFGFSM